MWTFIVASFFAAIRIGLVADGITPGTITIPHTLIVIVALIISIYFVTTT